MELQSILAAPSSHPGVMTDSSLGAIASEPVGHRGRSDNAYPSPQAQGPVKDGLAPYPGAAGGDDAYSLPPAPPVNQPPKNVTFELVLDDTSKYRARIPMRVQIFPHDTAESIVTTVKNFYGIYKGPASGVTFQDRNGTPLIARYEHFTDRMIVYVRVVTARDYPDTCDGHYRLDAVRPTLDEPFEPTPSRPVDSRSRDSVSPAPARGRRSASTQNRRNKSRGDSAHRSLDHSDGDHNKKGQPFSSSDISMENILQDGRRKRPKFESSELPLFAPPQIPMTSSSPQRRDDPAFARPMQRSYAPHPFPSPQSYGTHEQLYNLQATPGSTMYTPAGMTNSRRSTGGYPASTGPVLPTPDPTIASCISDEDVAMQLIRLGDASNFSHGRTSASTLDDAFSANADASSSTGVTTDGDPSDTEENVCQWRDSSPILPPGVADKQYKKLDDILPSCDSSSDVDGEYYDDDRAGVKAEQPDDPIHGESVSRAKRAKINPQPAKLAGKPGRGGSRAGRGRGGSVARGGRKAKSVSAGASHATVLPQQYPLAPPRTAGAIPSPTPSSRKPSMSSQQGHTHNHTHVLGTDEEDLSSKPRCQRCRKSKKGCDRQRPCGRCKDAGIGLDGCISEDEGNGRKGRYGRHMGVPIKQAAAAAAAGESIVSMASAAGAAAAAANGASGLVGVGAGASGIGKKRKR